MTDDNRQRQTASEPGADRGRGARTPSEISSHGWKDILLGVYENMSKHRIILVAAGITFYSILALFPAIAALVAVYGLFADPGHDSRASRPAVWVRARGSN
jgi:membrane protein